MSSDTERWSRIEEVFHEAAERSPETRAAYLENACGDDDELRVEVEQLLSADADAETFIEPPSAHTLGLAMGDADGAASSESRPTDGNIGRRVGAWELQSPLGEGGMGKVYLATRADGQFEMRAAVKLIRRGLATDAILSRFRHERQTLARLEHPHIARLLDGGETDDGLPYLAMEVVDGQPLDTACDEQRLDVDARLSLFLDVCSAVDYAHRNLVVHRDLKPSNILVDERGVPRLLDFGIAKVLDPEFDPALTAPESTPLTPRYASPEQLRGEAVTTATDVYALGVILYELLAGRHPQSADTRSADELRAAVCERDPPRPSTIVGQPGKTSDRDGVVRTLDPAALSGLRSEAPRTLRRKLAGDLDNIVLKALSREPERRYPSVAELAEDISRFLDGMPVRARPDEWSYRAARFVSRHRVGVGAGLAVAGALLMALGVFVTSARRDAQRLDDILSLSDVKTLDDLLTEMPALWPAHPHRLDDLHAWRRRALQLVARLPRHESKLAELVTLAHAEDTEGEDIAWWRGTLAGLVNDLRSFSSDDPFGATFANVERRIAYAGDIEQRSIGDHAPAWADAIDAVAASPHYGGMLITPQLGLVPLRPDPHSGLWEFWHVRSGEAPVVGADGELVLDVDSSLVFVLLPGGTFTMGAQKVDPGAAHHDGFAEPHEAPVRPVELTPFLLSKYELTQAQWLRITNENPSDFAPPEHGVETMTLVHPVETVSWERGAEVLAWFDLQHPTEAQWEYACRAGTSTPWSCGDDAGALDTVANLADLFAGYNGGARGWNYQMAVALELDDGCVVHAPVDRHAPNDFGLHAMHGNVWEWCRDAFLPYDVDPADGDGERRPTGDVPGDGTRVARGGGYFNPPPLARSSHRWSGAPAYRSHSLGLRPARALD